MICLEFVWYRFSAMAHGWVQQNRASPFASDFYRRLGYRREFRSEGHVYPFSSQKKSRFASDFLRRGNRASWGLRESRDFSGSGKNRSRNRRESRDFGALRCTDDLHCLTLFYIFVAKTRRSAQSKLFCTICFLECLTLWSTCPKQSLTLWSIYPEKTYRIFFRKV